MPRKRLPPHLFLERRKPPKQSFWRIRDGKNGPSTGCGEYDLAGAETALADYIAAKYLPPTGLGARLLIDEVIAAYLKGHADEAKARDFIVHTARPILEWWTGKRILDVNKTNCKAYVKWRTAQYRRQHPNSKKPRVKVSDQTARHDLKTLRAALNW